MPRILFCFALSIILIVSGWFTASAQDGGYTSFMAFDPKQKTGIIALFNSTLRHETCHF